MDGKECIRAHDRLNHCDVVAGRFVIEDVDFNEDPLLEPQDMANLLEVNRQMLQYTMAEYIKAVHGGLQVSLDDIILR